MNIVIISPGDFIDEHRVRLTGRRFEHISKVHRAHKNTLLKVGLIDGLKGSGTVLGIDSDSITLHVTLNCAPLKPLPLTLLLALPRPKMLKRILQSVASLGVKEIYLINSYKVEKSYWSSPVLTESSINEHLQLGLEQAGDTISCNVYLYKRFKPFVEDQLAAIVKDSQKILAHPYDAIPIEHYSVQDRKKTILAIGPEGGFIDYEVQHLQQLGFTPVSLGERILRVETAIPYTIAKLFN